MRVRFALPLLALVVASPLACKKKPLEEVKKEIIGKKEILEVPLPDGAFGEIVIKDPEALAAKLSKGAGLEPMIGASPYEKLLESVPNEDAKKALKAVDPHGTIAAVGLMKFSAPGEKAHGVVAARLKDPAIAADVLEVASKSGGKLKGWESKVLETKAYESEGVGVIAVYGEIVLAADTREALESAGKYVAWRSAKSKVDHELIARVPMDRVGPELKKLGSDEYAKIKPADIPPKVKAELDPVVPPVLNALSEMGEALLYIDTEGDNLKVEEFVATKGSLSAWLAKVPNGDAAPLLSMPKGESVAFYRYPDGLGPLLYSLADAGIDGSPLSTADRAEASKQLRILGKSVGHSIGYATDSGKGGAGAPGAPPSLNSEHFFRIDLDDPAAAKGAIASLRKLVEKALGTKTKLTGTPYKKFGGEGETIATPAMIPAFGTSAATATKDSQLFVDLCLGCIPSMVDSALDPATKTTLGDDPAAKAKIGEFPNKGIITASWGTALGLPGMGSGMGAMLGAPPSPKKPGAALWGYSQVKETQLYGKGAIPMALVGDFAKSLLAIGMMGGPPGGMGGMGGAPPF